MDSRDDTRTPPSGSPFYEASFIQSASSPASRLMVRVDAFGDAPFGDPDGVVWSPLGGALPAAGDRCLVAESDDGSWWVLAWWSALQEVSDRASGSSSAAWPGGGAVRSNTATVPHGLDAVPSHASVDAYGTTDIAWSVISKDATNIVVQGFYLLNVNLTGTWPFRWIAFR